MNKIELSYASSDRSLFKKYAKLVTWFANTKVGKTYLSLPDKPIALMLPNGYHLIKSIEKDRTNIEAVFYTRPVYAKKMYVALSLIDSVVHMGENAGQSLALQHILITMVTSGAKSLPIFAIPLTTDTFRPDPDTEVTSVDGHVGYRQTDQNFNVIHDAASATTTDDSGTSLTVTTEDAGVSNKYNEIYRVATLFDTSSIPNAAVISAATLSTFGNTTTNVLSQSIGVVTCTPASNVALQASDYAQFQATRQATDINISSLSASAYNDWPLNATGLSNINVSGITKFGFRLAGDIDNSAFTWISASRSTYGANSAETASTTSDPKLVVTYSLPGGGAALLPMIDN